MLPEDLEYKYSQDSVFSKAEYNALVTAAKRLYSGDNVWHDPNTTIETPNAEPEAPLWKLSVNVDVPAFSCLMQKRENSGIADQDMPIASHGEALLDVNDIVYLTNGSYPIFASQVGGANGRVIGSFLPTRLRIDLTSGHTKPIPGLWCGPVRGQFGVCLEGCGLVCIATEKADVDSSSGYAWCVQPGRTPIWLVKTTILHPKDGGIKDVEVWAGPAGQEIKANPEIKFKATNRGPEDIAPGKFCLCIYAQGVRYLVPLEAGSDDTLVKILTKEQDSATCCFRGSVIVPNTSLTSWCGDPFPEGGACLIKLANSLRADELVVGDIYQGVKIGKVAGIPATEYPDDRPVYAIWSHQKDEIVLFQMTEDLDLGMTDESTNNAMSFKWNNTTNSYDDAGPIIVHDQFLDKFQSSYTDIKTGSYGYARRRSTADGVHTGVFQIINMQNEARMIRFTAPQTNNMFDVVIDSAYDGRRDPIGLSKTSADPLGWYRDHNNARGFAYYNPYGDSGKGAYIWIIAESSAGFMNFYRAGDLPMGSARQATPGLFWGTQHDTLNPTNNNQIPLPMVQNDLYPNTTGYANTTDPLPSTHGISTYDNTSHQYKAIVADQIALFGFATLTQNLKSSDSVAHFGTGYTQATPFPFGLNTQATQAMNPFKASGKIGDGVFIAWSQPDQAYTVIKGGRDSGGTKMFRGTMNSNMFSNSPGQNCDLTKSFDGGVTPGFVYCTNVHGLSCEAGDVVTVIEDTSQESAIAYEILQVHHKQQKVVTNVQPNATDTGINQRKTPVNVMWDGPEESALVVFVAVTQNVVVDMVWNAGALTKRQALTYVWKGGTITDTEVFQAYTLDVVIDTEYSSGVFTEYKRNVIVIGPIGATVPTNVFTAKSQLVVVGVDYGMTVANEFWAKEMYITVLDNPPPVVEGKIFGTVAPLSVRNVVFDATAGVEKEYMHNLRVFEEVQITAATNIWTGTSCPTSLMGDIEGIIETPLLESPTPNPPEDQKTLNTMPPQPRPEQE